MATHWQTAAQSRSGERQSIGAFNSLEGKKGGGQLQSKKQIIAVTCKMCLFCEIHDIPNLKCVMENWSHFCIQFCNEKV